MQMPLNHKEKRNKQRSDVLAEFRLYTIFVFVHEAMGAFKEEQMNKRRAAARLLS